LSLSDDYGSGSGDELEKRVDYGEQFSEALRQRASSIYERRIEMDREVLKMFQLNEYDFQKIGSNVAEGRALAGDLEVIWLQGLHANVE
jgi:hypothetical protein